MKRLAPVLLVVMLALAMVAFLTPPAYAQSISQSFGGTANGASVININIPAAPIQGDAIVVFEWIGPVPNPCNFVLTPSDSQSQTWAAIGNCQTDGAGFGAMRAFDVASYSSNQPTTVNCNFGGPNGATEACYVFDVVSPGVITLAGSNSGVSGVISLASSYNAPANALLLAAAGIALLCTPVAPTPGFVSYTPASVCSTNGGMSGEFTGTGPGGLLTNAPMVSPFNPVPVIWAELLVQIAQPTTVTTTTAYTATVVGWLVPDATHFSNTLILIIVPLMGMVFAIFPFTLGKRPQDIGDRAILPGLIGLTLGSALADLTVNGTNVLQIPFADIIAAGVLTVLWWWNS